MTGPLNPLIESSRKSRIEFHKILLEEMIPKLSEQMIYDKGLDTRRRFNFRGKTLEEKQVKIFNRSAFIATNVDHIKNEPTSTDLAFLAFDIAGLREADKAEDGEGNKAADLMLNRIAYATNITLEKYRKENLDLAISFGRYGGDEFMISVLVLIAKKKSKA